MAQEQAPIEQCVCASGYEATVAEFQQVMQMMQAQKTAMAHFAKRTKRCCRWLHCGRPMDVAAALGLRDALICTPRT